MLFHILTVQPDGAVTARGTYTDDQFDREEFGPRMLHGFRLMLGENVPQPVTDTARFRLPLDPAGRFVLDWQQPDPFSALATFLVGGELGFVCVFLSGYSTLHDVAAVRHTHEMMAAWRGRFDPGAARPLAACVPLPLAVSDNDCKRVALWTWALGVAFFERAAAQGPPVAGDPSRN